MNKYAQIANEFRIIPRFLAIGYGVMCWRVVDWFMALDAPTLEQAGLVSVVSGASAVVFNFYVSSGPKD